jgi:hypothetical protein
LAGVMGFSERTLARRLVEGCGFATIDVLDAERIKAHR